MAELIFHRLQIEYSRTYFIILFIFDNVTIALNSLRKYAKTTRWHDMVNFMNQGRHIPQQVWAAAFGLAQPPLRYRPSVSSFRNFSPV